MRGRDVAFAYCISVSVGASVSTCGADSQSSAGRQCGCFHHNRGGGYDAGEGVGQEVRQDEGRSLAGGWSGEGWGGDGITSGGAPVVELGEGGGTEDRPALAGEHEAFEGRGDVFEEH
jgi:hypothetical protein